MTEQPQKSGSEQRPRQGCRKALWAFVASLVAMVVIVAAVIVGVTSWLGRYTHHDESVRVPVVGGMSVDEAMAALTDAGLVPMVIDSVYSDALPGTVIEQLPEGNLPVKLGRMVYLTINAYSRQMVVMPDLREWSSRQAQSRLQEAGFVVDSLVLVPYEYDDLVVSVSAGGRDVEPGHKYPIRTHLVLHVGTTRDLWAETDSVGFETDAEDEAAAAEFLME